MDDNKPDEEVQAPEEDLAAWADAKGLSFDEFCETIFITAISLGLLNFEGQPKKEGLNPSFKFSYPDEDGVCELYIRRVPKVKIITPKEKKIIQ